MNTTTEELVIRNTLVYAEFNEACDHGSESARAAAAAGVFTRTVPAKKGNRKHYEIVCPTRESAVALAMYVGFYFEVLVDNVREDCGDWEEKREQMSRRDAFGRAYRWLREYDTVKSRY